MNRDLTPWLLADPLGTVAEAAWYDHLRHDGDDRRDGDEPGQGAFTRPKDPRPEPAGVSA